MVECMNVTVKKLYLTTDTYTTLKTNLKKVV